MENLKIQSRPLRIAVDIDGVLADSHKAMEKVIYKKFGVYFPKEYAYQWDAEKSLKHITGIEISGKEYLALFIDVWNLWKEIPFTDKGVPSIVKCLEELGYSPTVVTYAIPGTWENKLKWLKRNIKGRFTVLNAAEKKGWKYDEDYDIFLDDCPHIAVGAKIKGKISLLYSQPWNLGVSDQLITLRVYNTHHALYWLERNSKPNGVY